MEILSVVNQFNLQMLNFPDLRINLTAYLKILMNKNSDYAHTLSPSSFLSLSDTHRHTHTMYADTHSQLIARIYCLAKIFQDRSMRAQ